MSKAIRRLLLAVALVCLVAGVAAATHNIWLRWVGEYLTYSEPPCKADAIVVLSGDYFGHRIEKAGELLQAGWAPVVLVTGAGTFYGVNEGEFEIQFAARAGYAADQFVNLRCPGRSTAEEARDVVAELRRRRVHRFMVVTSDFHSRRAWNIYRKAAPGIPFCVVASPDQDFSPDGWWHTREGRKVAFTECLKTVAGFLGI